MVLDSHLHLWDQQATSAPWLSAPHAREIRRPFSVADFWVARSGTEVTEAIVITAEESLAETERLLELAASDGRIAGVIGWISLASADVGTQLDMFNTHADRLLGIRQSLVNEGAHWLDQPHIMGIISEYAKYDRVLELLILPEHLPGVARLAQRLPQLRLVVDHFGGLEPTRDDVRLWGENFSRLAASDNVGCKLSGLDFSNEATKDVCQQIVDKSMQEFTPQRMMFGSNWPVCLLRNNYHKVLEGSLAICAQLSAVETVDVFERTARRTYRIAA